MNQHNMIARRAEDHEKVRQSSDYQAQIRFLQKTVMDLIRSIRLCEIAATRWNEFNQNYLLPTYMDDIIEAAITAQLAIENGALNPARRELRYMLEVAVNIAYVDEIRAKDSFSERTTFYRGKQVNKSNVDHIFDLPIRLLGDQRGSFATSVRQAWVKAMPLHTSFGSRSRRLCNSTISLHRMLAATGWKALVDARNPLILGVAAEMCVTPWVKASNYVHLTKRRVDQKLELREKGVTLGFETTDMLKDVVSDVHGVCSIVMVLTFETIGPSFTGDILVDNLDQLDDWAFHASGYVALVDAYYDYKDERKDKLDQHVQRRQQRVRYQIPTAIA